VTQALPRTVVVLGLASLLNDAASEMVTPLLPLFLVATLGAGPTIVGFVEGLAEATASLLKLVSGRLVDRGWPGRGLVLGGYTLSNVARPLIGLAVSWTFVLGLRFLDRVGKGIRSAPRDAMIAAAVAPEARGRAFGFQRSMDHTGAVIGPLLAFALLAQGVAVRDVIVASAASGAALVALLLFGLRSAASPERAPEQASPPLTWKGLDARLRRLLVACAILALATTPEAFLVLWARDRGVSIANVALLWASASLLKMAVAYPAGILSDRFGRGSVLAAGWAIRVLLLALLALVPAQRETAWALFILYAGSLALTEAAERSLVGDVAPADQRGTAFGVYHLVTGLLVLPGALAFGVVWEYAGASYAFGMAGVLTAIAVASMFGALGGLPARTLRVRS